MTCGYQDQEIQCAWRYFDPEILEFLILEINHKKFFFSF